MRNKESSPSSGTNKGRLACLWPMMFIFVACTALAVAGYIHYVNSRPVLYYDRHNDLPFVVTWAPIQSGISDYYGNYAIDDPLSNMVVLIQTIPLEDQFDCNERITADFSACIVKDGKTLLTKEQYVSSGNRQKGHWISNTPDTLLIIDEPNDQWIEFPIKEGQATDWYKEFVKRKYDYRGQEPFEFPNLAVDTREFFDIEAKSSRK